MPRLPSLSICGVPLSPRERFIRVLLVSLAGGALFAPGLRAQGPSANGPEPAATPQIHAEEIQINLDLIVRDKRNRPVVNLSASDLSVTDGGKPVQLSGLHLVTAQSVSAVRIALLFDEMTAPSAKMAQDFAARFLEKAPPNSTFAVLGVDRGLRLLEDYSADRAAVRAATLLVPDDIPQKSLADAEKAIISISDKGTLLSGANASVDDRANAKMMLSALEDSQRIVQERHAPSALAGLLALARAEQNLPGRKVVLFFSEGLRPSATSDELARDVVEAASRAGVSIYTVDTKGVQAKSFDVLTMMYAPSRPLAAQMYNPANSVGGNPTSPTGMWHGSLEGNVTQLAGVENNATGASSVQNDEDRSRGNALAFLATGTGGFAISTGDDPRKPLRHLEGDIGNYYEATYTPVLKSYDGQFHPLDIHALRAGVTVRSRSGYFALPPDAAGSLVVRPSEAPLLKLLSDTQPPSEIAFDQAVLQLGSSGADKETNVAAIEVPVSHLELRRDQQTMLYTARASILAEVKDAHGVVVERFHEEFARNGALESIDAARNGVVTMQRHFAAAPGSYVLESVVLDRISGKAGAQRTEFTIPAPAPGPWLSDVVLVRHMQAANGAPDPLEPLQYQNVRVVPNLDHKVSAGTAQISFLMRIQRAASASDGALTMIVERDGNSVTQSVSKIPAAASPTSSLDIATIQAGNLPPGTYHAEFTLAQGGRSASRDLTFTLDGKAGGKAPAEAADDEDTTDVPVDLDAGVGRFTPAPASNPPSEAFRNALLNGARERANSYLASLVNFKCIEMTDRYVDHKGNGKAKHDKIAELLTYENHEESRQVLEVNGAPGNAQQVDMTGARLEGAFGGVLQIVFDPQSVAQFEWQQRGALDGAAVDVFSYRVDTQHSHFSVTPLPASSRLVPFHGQVFIDAATRGVRRITIVADDIPEDSPIHASSLSIDYDYVSMNDHDYLVPVRGEMRMQLGKSEKIFHQIEFRDYHRFGSQTRIISVNP